MKMEKKSICSVEISRKLSEQSFKIDFFPFQVRLDEKNTTFGWKWFQTKHDVTHG